MAMPANAACGPFSVPDPLGDAWDEAMARNRLLQAPNDPLAFGDGTVSPPPPDPGADGLNDDGLPIDEWLARRAQQVSGGFDGAAPADDDPQALDASTVMAPGADDSGQIAAPPGGATAGRAKGGDNAGYWQLGAEWLTGLGPRHHEFGPDDPATRILMRHDHIQNIRDKIATAPPPVGNWLNDNYDLSGLKGIPEFLKDYSAIPTGGATGNLAAAYLGSYPLKYRITNIDKDGVATVDFDATNTSSMASALHIPYVGYLPAVRPRVDGAINARFPSGPGSPTSQHFKWSERIPLRGGATGTK
jgi:hypothetical protein